MEKLFVLILLCPIIVYADLIPFIEAPDGTFHSIEESNLPDVLEAMLYFETPRQDASTALITALQLALAAKRDKQIPLPFMEAILTPLEERRTLFAEGKTSMSYMLWYCYDALKKKIKIVKEYEASKNP